tara:strand:- start:59 stop:304 length:246 start_codon:yes stop_codon:yes gene_type:complete
MYIEGTIQSIYNLTPDSGVGLEFVVDFLIKSFERGVKPYHTSQAVQDLENGLEFSWKCGIKSFESKVKPFQHSQVLGEALS